MNIDNYNCVLFNHEKWKEEIYNISVFEDRVGYQYLKNIEYGLDRKK